MSNEELVLNWGVTGTGNIANDFCTVLRSLQSKHHNIVAIAARDIDEPAKFAARFNVPKYYESYDDFIADSNINIVYIGTINTTHKEISLKAIRAGKHVLCEKPMSLNTKDQEEVLNAAKEKGVFFMEGLWTRFFPVIRKIKQHLDDGDLGEVKFLSSNFLVPIKSIERIRRKDLGGGGLYDLGIYTIQLACLVFNHETPIKITATGHLMETGVDEACTIVLLYSGNRIAQLNVSTNCEVFDSSAIVGSKGILEIPRCSNSPNEYTLNGKRVFEDYPRCENTVFINSAGLGFEAEAVRDAISKGLKEHPYLTHDNSRLVAQILEECRKQLGYTE